ncbi:Sugar transporter SWEET1 [Babesia sp. Xinjiang]|uniref:Sugar transporter SWEET1 n=1 Tax=Babesia sp. Xinjiang TaxID=462227 RepID=UPI000A25BB2D|nr:Sugar transporter SWEET1 [Babesia sp. Xinjiang]ORM39845.1 Sugar transporter SWEET1 [Babesia sp. Xinjiang]
MSRHWRLLYLVLFHVTVRLRLSSQQAVVQDGATAQNTVVESPAVTEPPKTKESGGEKLKPITISAAIRDTGHVETGGAVSGSSNVKRDAPVVTAVPPKVESAAAAANTDPVKGQPVTVSRDGVKVSGDEKKEDGILSSFINWTRDIIQTDFNFLISSGTVMSSLMTQLIPLHTIMTIRWNKSTGNLKTLNFVTVAFANFLWSLYGILSSNTIIILSSLPGFFLNCCYILVFHRYCQDAHQLHILHIFYKVSGACCIILMLLYVGIEGASYLNFIGLFGGSIQAFSYIAPLFSIREIMKHRSTSALPTEISLANFIGSFFTLCYGFIIWDYIVIAPNFIGMISGMIQIILLILIPNNEKLVVAEVEILEKQHFKPILKPYMDI